MAHFAQLDDNNVVLQVLVIGNADAETEEQGVAFCKTLLGENTNWKQCSYNNRIRKQYPGMGYTYNPEQDIFVAPQPFPSWSLNAAFDWVAPVPMPDDGLLYYWDEAQQAWMPL